VGDDQNVVAVFRRVELIETPDKSARPRSELAQAFTFRRSQSPAMELATLPDIVHAVRAEDILSFMVSNTLKDAVMHLSQIRIELNGQASSNDHFSRPGRALKVAGVDGVELDASEKTTYLDCLLLSPLVQLHIEVSLKHPCRVGTCFTVSHQPECRRHRSCPTQARGRPRAALPFATERQTI
jgi:hypothetical protein